MNDKLYTPQEAADVLKLKKNTIYEMIKKGTIHATKMGKQFRIRESELENLLNPTATKIQLDGTTSYPSNTIYSEPVLTISHPGYPLLTGSVIVCGQDIILDMLCSAANASLGIPCFVRSYEGSYNGLHAMYKNEVHIASVHLWDSLSDSYNIPFIHALLPGEAVEVFHVMARPIGLYVAKGNPLGIHDLKDYTREDIQIVNREKGSGIRIYTDQMLDFLSLDRKNIKGYDRIVNSHLAAAAMVSKGGASCAIGTQNIALQFSNAIDFLFLKEEQYDLVFRKEDLEKKEIQTMLNILQSTSFKAEVDAIGIYNVTDMGKKLL